jgi:CheY-like chemotaxis protein
MNEPSAREFVLVVDDDPDIRESLETVLGVHGHPVLAAADGVEAIGVLRRERSQPCVILLDLMMPGMNGFEFRAELEADPALAEIPVVIITGAGVLADEKAGTLNAEVLRKPFDLKALLKTVKRFCPDVAPVRDAVSGQAVGAGLAPKTLA